MTAAWLPGVLWLLELALARRSLRLAALAGAALGCALLAGHPQTFLYIGYLTAAFLAVAPGAGGPAGVSPWAAARSQP